MSYVIISSILFIICTVAFFTGRAIQKDENNPEGDKKVGQAVKWAGVIVFVLLFGVWSTVRSFHSVSAGHVGVVYQFGNIVAQTDAGLVNTWPWQNLVEANTQVQRVSFPELDSFTSETQDVFIAATINYQVNPDDIQDLYRNVGAGYFDKLVPTRVNQLFKDETVKYRAIAIAPNRETIRKNVLKRLKTELAPFSIQIDDLLLDNIKFSPEFTKAIEDKQVATQEAKAARNRVAKAKAEANQVIAAARGQAKAQKLQRQTLTPLLVQKYMIDKLNPNVKVILLPSTSNFLLPGNLFPQGTP